MTWVKIDDGFPEHPKVGGLTDRAFRVHLTALCYSSRNLTDGHLTTKSVRVLAAILGVSVKKSVEELTEAELWHRTHDGYVINDYLQFNPSAEKVKEQRRRTSEARSQAGKLGAAAKWNTDGKHGKTDGKPHGNEDGKRPKVSMAPSRPLKRKIQVLTEPTPNGRFHITHHDQINTIDYEQAALRLLAAAQGGGGNTQ